MPSVDRTHRKTVFALGPDEHIELRHDVFAQKHSGGQDSRRDGVREGDRVLLCLSTSPEFITAFFGAVLLGAVPVAVALPGGFGGAHRLYRQVPEI